MVGVQSVLDKMIVLEEAIAGDDDGGQDLGGEMEEEGPIRDLELDREVSEALREHTERTRGAMWVILRDVRRHLHARDGLNLRRRRVKRGGEGLRLVGHVAVTRWQAILRKAPMLLKEEVTVLQKRATLLREVRPGSSRVGGVDVC